ncbi:ETC complex I subunit [Woodsholea maritima]|uniref:ETC complex I subunit n=1 Tax=Woodsholea maritima TaxID=240237 RepID=UPI00037CB99B|nr:ETC complex I subunit [Woodsholea maritima]
MFAKIYRPSKNAMQSGKARTKSWVLEFEPSQAKRPDPLMGWTTSSDMNRQVHLSFESQEEAVAYAKRHGIAFHVRPDHQVERKAKIYSDNFAYERKEPWSH